MGFLKGLIAVAKGKKDAGDMGLEAPMRLLSRHYFSRHAAIWAEQSVRLQQAFEGRANARAQERRGEIERELSELAAQLSVLTGR